MPKPIFFASPAEFLSWLKRRHADAAEVLVGFYKKDTGKPSLTWPESVDCALCFGWIDGIRKSLGDESYTIRFSPRKPTSTWSAINIRRVAELEKMGLMQAAGRKAFQERKDAKSAIYSYEQVAAARLSAAQEKKFRASKPAWAFFQAQPPGYRQKATYWVISAKREETSMRRLEELIDESSRQRRLGILSARK